MTTKVTLLLGAVLACGLAELGRAQRDHVFRLTTPLRLSAGHDQNFIVSGQELDDTVYLLTSPTLSLVKEGARTGFFLGYQPEFEFFVQNRGLNAWSHAANLTFSRKVTPRLTVELGDSFGYMQDPTRRFADSFLRLPRAPFQLNVAQAGFSYDFSRRTILDFRLENTISKVPVPGVFDQVGYSAMLSITRILTPKHEITVNYTHLRNRFLEKPYEAATIDDLAKFAHSAGLAYTYTPSNATIIRLAGGGIRAGHFGYTASGSVERRLGRLWGEASYQRYLSFLGGLPSGGSEAFFSGSLSRGLLPTALIETIGFRLHGKISDRVGLDLRGLRAKTDSGFDIEEIRSLMGRGRLDYRLTKRLVLFANVEYYGQNLNEFLRIPMSRKRYFGGLEIAFMRPKEEEADPARRRRARREEAESAEELRRQEEARQKQTQEK